MKLINNYNRNSDLKSYFRVLKIGNLDKLELNH